MRRRRRIRQCRRGVRASLAIREFKVDVAFTVKMTSLATAPTVWTNTVWEVGNVNKHDGSAVVSEWAAR